MREGERERGEGKGRGERGEGRGEIESKPASQQASEQASKRASTSSNTRANILRRIGMCVALSEVRMHTVSSQTKNLDFRGFYPSTLLRFKGWNS